MKPSSTLPFVSGFSPLQGFEIPCLGFCIYEFFIPLFRPLCMV